MSDPIQDLRAMHEAASRAFTRAALEELGMEGSMTEQEREELVQQTLASLGEGNLREGLVEYEKLKAAREKAAQPDVVREGKS